MGIQGLKTYILERSEKFLKPFKLHNSYLVVDGNCLMNKIYTSNHCNFCFGGEYGDFAYYVSEFFDSLLKCNVTPLVIFDGGVEEKKAETVYERAREKVVSVAKYPPQYGNDPQIIPVLTSNVFKYILEKKGIKCVRTLFEADNEIAAVARFLNCPVVSDDSDFFIFDVMYIPYDTLENKVFKNSSGSGFVKHCKLFKSEFISEVFPRFDKKVFPLMAALLGNDYLNLNLSGEVFENFFNKLPVPNDVPVNLSWRKIRIESVFRWIQCKSIDKAVTQVLRFIEVKNRLDVIKMIEVVINGYLLTTPKTLDTLDIPVNANIVPDQKYKYNNGIYDVFYPNKNSNEIPILAENFENKPLIVKYLKGIPVSVLQKFKANKYPAYFMDIWTRNPFINSEQIEDITFPSTIGMSIKIMKVTFKILRSNLIDESCIVQFIVRGDGTSVVTRNVNYSDVHIKESIIPTLKGLAKLSHIEKLNILINTLEVPKESLTAFLPSWRLYVSVIKYWLDEADPIFVTKCHFYALIMCFVYHVVKKVINSNEKESSENSKKEKNLHSESMSVHEALKKVSRKDCEKIQKQFYRPHMVIQIKSFKRIVIHSFALFQSCLKQSMYLNELLDNPLEKADVSEFFSGVMICNFYHDFVKQRELKTYLLELFKDSPSVLQLFFSITTTINSTYVEKQ